MKRWAYLINLALTAAIWASLFALWWVVSS